MTIPEPTFRPGTPADTEPCYDLFLAAIRDLTVRQGIPWDPDRDELWGRLQPMYDHLARHAAEWWVAVDSRTAGLIGYARSVERGGLFELSEFFVHPASQAAGLGRRLLELAFPPARGQVRAIIATTDVRAQARYYAAGTAARFPIAALSGEPRPDAPTDPSLTVDRATAADVPALRRIEAAVLEFDRGDEFTWLLEDRQGFIYRRAGSDVGFSFLGSHGLGPIVALEAEEQPAILGHVEAWAAAAGRQEMALEVPMVNEVAMRHLLGRGFRMDPFLTLLMSSRPFGRFDRFIGFAPPFVL